ncbi:MAG: adenosylcobinamide-GDP ribazoletransferase [Oscillospiraceae bacterium]|nr:adenosylcobinamide-GDP ribazoletransferase [Oscillospiraceae bacterium]
MHGLKSFLIAFSLYSKIPMPQFPWKDEDMRYTLCFFPLVGVVIGGCVFLWWMLCETFALPTLCCTAIGAAIPLLVTGGFHVDGFLDTMDAFRSYQPREKKLEILQDSHIGAFAVISFAIYGLLYLGAFSLLEHSRLVGIVCLSFCLARCLSGIAVVSFPAAKKKGLLFLFASRSHRRIVRWSLYLQGAGCVVGMVLLSPLCGAAATVAALLSFLYYYYRTKKELGGITGDTAGYFVLLCEESVLLATGAMELFSLG